MLCRAIYVIGGRNDTTFLEDVEKYDLTFGTWSAVAPLPQPLRCTTAVSYRGNLYVFGGETSTAIVNTAYKYVKTLTDLVKVKNTFLECHKNYARLRNRGVLSDFRRQFSSLPSEF